MTFKIARGSVEHLREGLHSQYFYNSTPQPWLQGEFTVIRDLMTIMHGEYHF